jgi:hypothetical protein
MTIDPRLRKKKRSKDGKAGGALMLNIRVRHIRKKGSPATSKGTVRDAIQHLLDYGTMPPGWQFMAVDWKNPKRYGSGWQTGVRSTDDLEEFVAAFGKVVQSQIRMGVVDKVKK